MAYLRVPIVHEQQLRQATVGAARAVFGAPMKVQGAVAGYISRVPSRGLLGAAGVSPKLFNQVRGVVSFGGGGFAPGSPKFIAGATLGVVPGGSVVEAGAEGVATGAEIGARAGAGGIESTLARTGAEVASAAKGTEVQSAGRAIEASAIGAGGKTWYAALKPSLQFAGKAAVYGGAFAGAGYAGAIGLTALGQGAYNLGTGVGGGIGNLLGLGSGAGASGGGGSSGGGSSGSTNPLDTLLSSPLLLLIIVGVGAYVVVSHERKKPAQSGSSKSAS